MYFYEDEMLAKSLQNQYSSSQGFYPNQDHKKENINITDAKLEYIDPTPNVHMLFVQFDKRFFWTSLESVEIKWSQKMTSCAGVCAYRGKRGGCVISLSAPLLSLRPRKDLVETLLHEMIHAYLFVTENDDDRDGHGPQFHKHMHRINKEAGTNITVYHTFLDEVEYHQRHIWRCNGACQHRKPFFGLVRRANNRAPGPSDFWWDRHSKECGGTFIKISEPEKVTKKRGKGESNKAKVPPPSNSKDIRQFFTPLQSSSSTSNVVGFSGLTAGTVNKTKSSTGDEKPAGSNVFGFKDLSSNAKKPSGSTGMLSNRGSGTLVITNPKTKKNTGKTETETQGQKGSNVKRNKTEKTTTKSVKSKESESKKKTSDKVDHDIRTAVRNVWANKVFPETQVVEKSEEVEPKKRQIECPICDISLPEIEFEKHIDDCLIKNTTPEKVNGSTSNIFKECATNIQCQVCDEIVPPSEMGKHLESCVSSVFLEEEMSEDEKDRAGDKVSCPVCNKEIQQSHLNEHLENCLNCSFENETDEFEPDEEEEVECKSVPCPCCLKWFLESEMNSHVDDCLTMMAIKNGLLEH